MSWKVANRSELISKGPAVPKGCQSFTPLGSPGDEAVIGTEKSKKMPSMAETRRVNMMRSWTGKFFRDRSWGDIWEL